MKSQSVIVALYLICFASMSLHASIFPIPLSQRITESSHIVLASLESQDAFRSEADQLIYTLNVLKVKAYLKGASSNHQIGLISIGGSLDHEGQLTYPSVQLEPGKSYVFFLEPDPLGHRHAAFPDLLQLRAYASIQGALALEDGKYQDLLFEALEERALLQKVFDNCHEKPIQPDGRPYIAQTYLTPNQASRMVSISSVASLSATGMVAGTIDTPRVAVITGMGFDPFGIGSTGSTVEFSSALDGGVSFIGLDEVASDILSWTNTEIQVKIPGDAGSGQLRLTIFGNAAVTHPITIDWAVQPKYSISQSWPVNTRNRLELIKEGSVSNDGYAFQFDNTYWTNLDAVESFLRAVQTWRCNTFINLNFETAPNNAVYVNGNGSQVRFASSATLGAGVLGQAHIHFRNTFSAILPTCIQENTLWYITDMDILFVDNPAPFSWNFTSIPTVANSYDFESVALKMVGLASGLGYINQTGTAMYYTIGDGQDVRNLTANEIVAGTHKLTHSVTPSACKTLLASNGLMVAVNGAQNCILELPQPGRPEGEGAFHPYHIQFLPESEQLQLDWMQEAETQLTLLLFDLQGRRVLKQQWLQRGMTSQKFVTNELPAGLYAFRIIKGEQVWFGKVVK